VSARAPLRKFGAVGPNASNLASGDTVTFLRGEHWQPTSVRVIRTYTDGDIVLESGPELNRTRFVTHESWEGTRWARGHGDDVVAALLLTRSAV